MSRKLSFTRSDLRVIELARGGMGTVEIVLRQDGDFSRLMAVKRLLPEHQQNEEFRTMFLSEARVAGLLRHPNVVSVLDVGEDEQGPFLVMDYIEGFSLSRLLKATGRAGRLLPVQLCLRIARNIAAGLHAAHELRSREGALLHLVHRDVTPQNVLLSYDGEVLVADFGIAKVMGQTNTTSTGVLKGKLGYMSPEQLRFREPDRRSDLFSLGVVLFELLSCERMYGGKGTEGARRILEEPPPDILEYRDDVDDSLVALLFDLLAKEPDDRPATAALVAKRLDDAIATLALDEEVLSVKAYLDEHFGAERSVAQADMEAAIADAKQQSATRRSTKQHSATQHSTAQHGAIADDRPVANPAPSKQAPRRFMIASFVCVALAAVGIAYWALSPSSDSPGSPPSTEPATADLAHHASQAPEGVEEPAPERAEPAEPVIVEAEPLAMQPNAVVSNTAEPSAVEPNAAPSPMRRRARRRPRRAESPESSASMEETPPGSGVFVMWEAGE